MKAKGIIIFVVSFGIGLPLSAQQVPTHIVSIGEIGAYRITIEGGELKPRDLSMGKPTATRPIWLVACDREGGEGNRTNWIIRYAAWKPGDYDLRNLFAWSDGFNRERVRPMIVTVADPLTTDDQGKLEPIPFGATSGPGDFFAIPMWIPAVVWMVGFIGLAWFAWLRPDHQIGAVSPLLDPMRRGILEGLQAGSRSPLTPQTRAEMQRQFLALLLRDFQAPPGTLAEMLQWTESHPQAGPLLEKFDAWISSAATQPTPAPPTVVGFLEGVSIQPS